MPAIGAFLLSYAGTAKASNASLDSNIVGSLIITDKPDSLLMDARSKGLRVGLLNKTGKAKTIISLKEMPNNPKVKELAARLGVQVLPNYSYKIAATPNDTKYYEQWNLPKISSPEAWEITQGSNDVSIAIVDGGVLSSQTINGTTYTQPDFPADKIWKNADEIGATASEGPAPNCTSLGLLLDKSCNNFDDDSNGKVDDWQGWDFMGGWRGDNAGCPNFNDATTYNSSSYPGYVEQDSDPQPYSCDNYLEGQTSLLNKNHYSGDCSYQQGACYIGHGTMAGSVASATTNNNSLVAGVDHNAKIMNLRVFDGYGITDTAHVTAAINYAVEQSADVISMSLSVNDCTNNNFTDAAMEAALKAASDANIVAVAASGNGGQSSSICYPASSQYVIAVGATNTTDVRQSYSDGSSKLDVVAPSGIPVANAPSAYLNTDYYANAHGTSFATPGVAGVAGLLKATNKNISPIAVRNYIRNGANKVAGMNGQNFTNSYGYGRVNAFNSLRLATGNNTYPYAWQVASSAVYANPTHTQGFTTNLTVAPGEKLYTKVSALNDGYYSWQNTWANIGTQNPQDRASAFYDADTWFSSNRPTNLKETSLLPEKTGTYEFALKAPAITGAYSESFNGLAEGRSWFKNTPFTYDIDVVEPVLASNSKNISLTSDQYLIPGGFLLSPDRHTILKLQYDGNLVLYRSLKPVWSSNSAGTRVSRLVMQPDGNLVLYDTNGGVVWSSGTHGNSGARVTTQTDGNLVIYSSSEVALWTTTTSHYPDNLRIVDKNMETGYVLHSNQELETANKKHRFVLQPDGNLVLYSLTTGKATWASWTVGKNPERLVLQSDGNLVLYDTAGKALWYTRTDGKGPARLIIQQDGNLVLYKTTGGALWNTQTSGS